jgi:hypothetical protein
VAPATLRLGQVTSKGAGTTIINLLSQLAYGSGSSGTPVAAPAVHDTVYGFRTDYDVISSTEAVGTLLGHAQTVSGNTTVTSSDGSTITLRAIARVNASFFK